MWRCAHLAERLEIYDRHREERERRELFPSSLYVLSL